MSLTRNTLKSRCPGLHLEPYYVEYGPVPWDVTALIPSDWRSEAALICTECGCTFTATAANSFIQTLGNNTGVLSHG